MRSVFLAAILATLTTSLPARASPEDCKVLTDPKEIELCQKQEIEKQGPLYFSVYERDGKRHRVRIENMGRPCMDIAKDGEFLFFRDKREMRKNKPYKVFHCKAGKEVAAPQAAPAAAAKK